MPNKEINTEFGVFKEASYGESWILDKKLKTAYFNKIEAEIIIKFLDNLQTQDALLDLLGKFVSLPENECSKLEKHIFQNYIEFGDAVGFEELPEIKNSSEVWQYLNDTRIYFFEDYYTPGILKVGFTFESDWEQEHGLGILLNSNFELIEVGYQDIVF